VPLVMVKSDKRAREKPCLRCGYSLRRIDALHCPECGLSVWRSLNANDALEWSNPPWLAKLAVACTVLAVVQVIGIVAYVLSDISIVMILRHMPRLMVWWLRFWPWSPLIAAAYQVPLAAGLVLLSANEGRHPDKCKPFRWACRIVAAVCTLAALVSLVSLVNGMMPLARPGWGMFWTASQVVLKASIIAGVLAAFAYLRKLAQRIPHGRVAKVCGWMLLVPLLSLVKTVPFFAMRFAFDLFGVLFACLPLIYLPVSAGMLMWFANEFRKASVAAEKGWASETASAEAVGVPPDRYA
jgi:hypothetical protein